MQVSSIMTREPVWVATDTPLDEALALMDGRGFRHLPVLQEEAVVGILSDRDVLEATGWLPRRVHECRGPAGAEDVPLTVAEVMHVPVFCIEPDEDVTTAAIELVSRGIGSLPVVEGRRLVGILTERDLLRELSTGTLRGEPVLRDRVAEHMTPDPTTVPWYKPIKDALALCRANGIRHLPMIEGEEIAGLLSDRDLRRALGAGRHEETPVDEIVTWSPVTVAPDATMLEAAQLLSRKGFSCLPVVDDTHLVGILTLTDVLVNGLDAFRIAAPNEQLA